MQWSSLCAVPRAPRQVLQPIAGVLAAALVLAGCGGSQKAATATAPVTAAASTSTPAATPPPSKAAKARIRVTINSPTHHPRVNVPWPVTITVSDALGKPIAATLTMRVLFAGQPVGKIDNGAVYRFVGTWQERPGNGITWPAASRGQPLTFQAVVKAQGVSVRKSWAISVR